jgi:hypothetical protein
MLQWAARNPRQITTQNINGDRGKHEDGAYPKTPVTMHPRPVRTWIGLAFIAFIAAISLEIVLTARHFVLSDIKRIRGGAQA